MKGRDLLMEWTLRTRDELLTLFATEPEPTADAVLALQEAFVALAERLPEWERQVNQTSQNSHQPPSKEDVFNPPPSNPKSLRGHRGRASGGSSGVPRVPHWKCARNLIRSSLMCRRNVAMWHPLGTSRRSAGRRRYRPAASF